MEPRKDNFKYYIDVFEKALNNNHVPTDEHVEELYYYYELLTKEVATVLIEGYHPTEEVTYLIDMITNYKRVAKLNRQLNIEYNQ